MILLVLGMVALLGFSALAVDGGMVYADRRQAQNGADAASLAGGGGAALYLESNHVNFLNWDCGGNVAGALSAAEAAAIVRAVDNGYTIDGNTSDNHGVDATCGLSSSSGWPDRFIDVRSVITTDTPTAFAHFIFSGPLRNTVEAVTRIRPRAPLAFGYAIVSLSDECGGIEIRGTSDTVVIGGGIFSNSCIEANGNTSITVTGGNIGCVGSGCFDTSGHPTVSPAPQQGQPSIPNDTLLVPPPNCADLTSRDDPGGSGTIQPGLYSSGIHLNNHQVIEFDPGLYCISGGMRINGGAEVSGSGVTIYVMDGDIDIDGGATVNLAAPPAEDCENCPPAIPGVLVYLADGNDGEVSLLGNGESNYIGTVYAPDGLIEVGGTGDSINYHSQLIGWTVITHGNAVLDVTYEGENNYQQPAVLELYK